MLLLELLKVLVAWRPEKTIEKKGLFEQDLLGKLQAYSGHPVVF